jgi:hypothetical protein
MSLQVRQLNCPNCGAPLNVQSMGSKQVVCPNCGSQIDLTRPPFSIMGNVGNRPEPTGTPFQLGMQGTVGQDTYSVIGRIRYVDTGETYPSVGGHYDDDDDDDEGSDIWDEWLLLSAQGAYRWFSDSEDVGLVLWYPFTPTVPVDPSTIVRGGTIDLGQGPARVRSRGSATINYLEGEMTWSARVGDRMNYAEAVARDNTMLSVEWTENEAEFYAGQRLDRETTEKAFGINRVIPPSGGRGKRAGCSVSMVVLVIIVIVACLVIAALVPSTSSGGGIGGVRGGSSGRSFGGGGSSGGGGGGGGK